MSLLDDRSNNDGTYDVKIMKLCYKDKLEMLPCLKSNKVWEREDVILLGFSSAKSPYL